MRDRLRQQQEQQRAQTQMQGLLGSPELQTPQGQQQMLGLLSQVAPEAVAGGLLGQMFPQEQERGMTGDVAQMTALGMDLTPENFVAYQQMKSGDETDIKKLLTETNARQAQLAADMAEERLVDIRRQRAEAERTEAEKKIGMETSAFRTSRDIEEAFDIVGRLDDSMLTRPGLGMKDLRKTSIQAMIVAKQLRGEDASIEQQMLADLNRLTQIASGSVFDNLDRLKGVGVITEGKFNAFKSTLLDADADANTIMLSLSDLADANLLSARQMGFELPNQERMSQIARREFGGRQSEQANNINRFETMSFDDMGTLDIGKLNAAEKRALDKRLKELGY